VPWGEYYEPTHEGSEAKVELVAGLIATQPAVTTGKRPTPDVIQAIFDELDHVVELVALFNLSLQSGDSDAASLRYMSATRWMTVRGSSFAAHGENLAIEIYRPQNDWLHSHLGFTIEDLVAVGKTVTALMSERRNAVTKSAVDAANEAMTGVPDPSDPETLGAYRKAILNLLTTHENGVRGAMTVTADEICNRDPSLRRDNVESILRELSVTVGSLDEGRYTGLYDEHPLRTRPFLEFGGEYLLAIPGAITRDVNEVLESRLLEGNPGFSAQRAKTLDRLAVDYLVQLLPGARGFTNLFYDEAEVDGLVLFDDVAVVVEGKASAISVQGQRGDLVRLGRDMGQAVEEAWRQGSRARDYLLQKADAVFKDERGSEVVRVPAGRIHRIEIVNPTLHELAGLGPQLPRLRSLGLFETGEYPWSVYINDLRVIAETSENAAVFLHYLIWRNRLPLGDRVVAFDEIDLWASYLLCERFGMLHDGGEVIVGNSTTDFDAYYDGLAGLAPTSDRPVKFAPDLVRRYVNRLAATRPPGWREATGVCLDLSIPELAVVDLQGPELAAEAAGGRAVATSVGRLLLVGVPRGVNAAESLFAVDAEGEQPTLAIACRLALNGDVEIVAAQYRKPVTFELSQFEKQALMAVARA
jgi:hypothetical protein